MQPTANKVQDHAVQNHILQKSRAECRNTGKVRPRQAKRLIYRLLLGLPGPVLLFPRPSVISVHTSFLFPSLFLVFFRLSLFDRLGPIKAHSHQQSPIFASPSLPSSKSPSSFPGAGDLVHRRVWRRRRVYCCHRRNGLRLLGVASAMCFSIMARD